jgi:hypothetical protein
MYLKRNRIALIIALVLLIVAAVLVFSNSKTTLRRNATAFAVSDTASITKIFLADKNNKQVLLEKNPDGTWTVDGKFPAQEAKVQAFLKTLMDIQVRNPVPLVARNNVITRMAAIAKKVEIYQVVPRIDLFGKIKLFPHLKNTRTYYVGDVTQDNQGTFMLMEGAEEPYVVSIPNFRGFVAARYSTNPSDWRDYTVFRTKIGEIASVKVEFPQLQGESYEFEVDANKNIRLTDITLMQPVPTFDTIRALNFLNAFRDIRFESLLADILQKPFIDSVLASTPMTIITLKDREGQVNLVKIYKKQGYPEIAPESGAYIEPVDLDRAYALVNDGQDFVLIQYYVFDAVTRHLGYFTRQENPVVYN